MARGLFCKHCQARGLSSRRHADSGIYRAEEELRISSGCLVGFLEGVDYDVQMVKGFQSVITGREGLFMKILRQPEVVWLSSMSPR